MLGPLAAEPQRPEAVPRDSLRPPAGSRFSHRSGCAAGGGWVGGRCPPSLCAAGWSAKRLVLAQEVAVEVAQVGLGGKLRKARQDEDARGGV
eukprot:SM000051S17552  [mRNA]  locus=s51:279131:279602:- [translate_table: standard]